jgi:hypothetical protein
MSHRNGYNHQGELTMLFNIPLPTYTVQMSPFLFTMIVICVAFCLSMGWMLYRLEHPTGDTAIRC